MDRPADTRVVLVLKGPLEGYTGKLREWHFENGRHTLTAPPSEQGSIIKYLNRCYQAVPEKQQDYDGNAMPELEVRMVLQGPLAGHTGKLRDWEFEDGVCVLKDLPGNLEGAIKYLGRCYQAFPDTSSGLEEGVVVDAERAALAAAIRKEARSGERNVQEEAIGDKDNEVLGDVQQDKEAGEEAAGEVERRDESEARDTGVPAEGDGKSSRLAEVVASLDRNNEKHWTKTGRPSVFAVRTLMGDDSITAAQIDEVWSEE